VRRIVAVASVLIALSLAYLFVGFIVARGQFGQADDALRQSIANLKQSEPLLSGDALANDVATINDPNAAVGQLDGEYANLKAEDQVVADDQVALDAAARGLGSSWMTAPEGQSLRQARARLEHARAAFGLVTRVVAADRAELDFFTIFLTALGDFSAAGKAGAAHDVAAARVSFGGALGEFQKGAILAKGPDIPPQFVDVIAAFEAGCSDGKAFFEAAQAGNQGAMVRLSAAVKADAAHGSVDSAGVAAWIKQHFDDLKRSFDSELAKASAT
jgi:hypothetical protein